MEYLSRKNKPAEIQRQQEHWQEVHEQLIQRAAKKNTGTDLIQRVGKKPKRKYNAEDVRSKALEIVQYDSRVKNTILLLQCISEELLMEFMKPDGKYLPRLGFSDKISAGSTPEDYGKAVRKWIYLDDDNASLSSAVSFYLHELNHYIDIWLFSKAAFNRGMAQTRDERTTGVYGFPMSAAAQVLAAGEWVTQLNKETLQLLQGPEEAGEGDKMKELRRQYTQWQKNTDPGKPTEEEFFDSVRDQLANGNELKRRRHIKGAKEYYTRWGAETQADYSITTDRVEMGYVFMKQAYGFYNPADATGTWAQDFDKKFLRQYAQFFPNEKVSTKSLSISSPQDADEREADAIASKVVSGESAEIKTGSDSVQRKGENITEVPADFSAQLNSSKGGGMPLDESVRTEMESKMSADFSGVKIHTDNNAAEMSESINAKAFTHGQDVYFNQGEFDAASNAGRELIAHELVHTQQQSTHEQSVQRQTITDSNTVSNTTQNPLVPQFNLFGPTKTPPPTKLQQYESKLDYYEQQKTPVQDIVKDEHQTNLDGWYNQLDSSSAEERLNAISSLDSDAVKGGWALLILASQEKPDPVRGEIKKKLNSWLNGRQQFKDYVLEIAQAHTGVLSDYAVLVLSDAGLGSFVDKSAFAASVSSKFFLARTEMTEVIGKYNPLTSALFNYTLTLYQSGSYAGTRPLQTAGLNELVQADLKIENLFNQQRLVRAIASAVTPILFSENSTADPQTGASAFVKEADNIWHELLLIIPQLSSAFNPEITAEDNAGGTALIKLYNDLKHRLSINSAIDLNSQITQTLSCVYKLKEGFKAWNDKDYYFYGRYAVDRALASYQTTLEAMQTIWNRVVSLADKNPDAYFSFQSILVKDLNHIVPRVNALCTALNIYSYRNTLDMGGLAKWWKMTSAFEAQDEKFQAHAAHYYALDGFLERAVDVGVNEQNSSILISDRLDRITTDDKYKAAIQYATSYAEDNQVFLFVVNLVATILLIIAAILSAGLLSELVIPEIAFIWGGGTGLLETAAVIRTTRMVTLFVNALGFTLFQKGIMQPALGQPSDWNNFGWDFTKNLILFGALGQVAQGYKLTVGTVTNVGGKVLSSTGLFAVELTTMEGVEFMFERVDKLLFTEEETQQLNIYQKLALDAVVLLGIKIGMVAMHWPKTPPSVSLEFDPQLADYSNKLNNMFLRMRTEQLTKAERQQFIQDVETLNTLRAQMLRKAAKTAETQELKNEYLKLADSIMARVYEIQNAMMNDFNVRLSTSNPRLAYFEGDPNAFRTHMLSEKGSSFVKVKGESNLWMFTNAEGSKMYFMRTEPALEVAPKLTVSLTGGVDLQQARLEYWTKAGDPSMANDAAGDPAVVRAIWQGWKPGVNADLTADQLVSAQQQSNRIKRIVLEKYFSDRLAQKTTDVLENLRQLETLEMLPMETINLFISRGVSARSMDAFADAMIQQGMVRDAIGKIDTSSAETILPVLQGLTPEADLARLGKLITRLPEIQELEIKPDFIKIFFKNGERSIRIDRAPLIENFELGDRVKERPDLYEPINNILSKIPEADRAALQPLINTLTDNGMNIYFKTWDKMGDITQAEAVKRAEFGDQQGYTDLQTIDYFAAKDISTELSGAEYTGLFSTKKQRSFKNKNLFKKDPGLKYQEDLNLLNEANKNMVADPTGTRTELEALKRRVRIKLRIENADERIELTYSDPELDTIYAEGKKLGLSDKAIDDYIYIGSRKKKPITATELVQQMNNNVNVVVPRGYPYLFESKAEFAEYGADFKTVVTDNGLPANDLAIQGSSLRTPAAKDVDSVIFVVREQFNQYLISRYSNRITKNKAPIDLTGKTHEDLVKLAEEINKNPKEYNDQAETFSRAVLNGSFNSKSDILKALKAVKKEMVKKYPHLNIETISIQYRGAAFDIEPSMKID